MKRRIEIIKSTQQPFMTTTTKNRLIAELSESKVKVAEAEKAIGDAGGTSDWHDNFALDQAFLIFDKTMNRKFFLEAAIQQAIIIEPRQEVDIIKMGNSALVQYEGVSEPETFTILGEQDAFTKDDWISFLSPLGSDLIGKKEGDIVTFKIKDRENKLTIIEVLPGNF